jgi:hypothetical protein
MTNPARRPQGEFTKREIVLFIFIMLVATFVTIEGTLFGIKTFVIGSPSDPLAKAGGLSPFQELEVQKGK